MIGVDIVTAESIYGFEPTQLNRYNIDTPSYTTERVVLPDTSSFIHSPIQPGYYSSGKKSKKPSSPTVSFPKYNNYVRNKNKFDKQTRVLLPLDLLGISNNNVQGKCDILIEIIVCIVSHGNCNILTKSDEIKRKKKERKIV